MLVSIAYKTHMELSYWNSSVRMDWFHCFYLREKIH